MRQYSQDRSFQSVLDSTIHDALIDDQELIPRWSIIDPIKKLRKQSNKEQVALLQKMRPPF
jgi:hypothetical protein